ncbi:hypothetical protein Tco_0388020, partial [Tanacetum coccineum]
ILKIMPPRKAPRTRTTPATTTNTTSVTDAQLKAMINQGVTAALAIRDADRSMNGDDSHNSGTGVRRTERVAPECTYQDFMKRQPLFFKGTEGVIELTQWFKRMETVFRISNCSVESQIKFATCCNTPLSNIPAEAKFGVLLHESIVIIIENDSKETFWKI